jgi:hypothetical protein
MGLALPGSARVIRAITVDVVDYGPRQHAAVMVSLVGYDMLSNMSIVSVSAWHYLMVEVDRLAEQVVEAWDKFGIRVSET